jgi:hypothetical protein
MVTLAVEPELYQRLEHAASEYHLSTDQILSDALRQYLWSLNRQKISEETAFYRQQYPQLRPKYLGRYIAMRDGRVVDDDADFSSLRRRVREHFGSTPVMITLVSETAETTLTRTGFRLENSQA